MVDPDGGYINQSSAGQAARARFLNQQAWDRTYQRNRYSYEFLYNNYKNAIEELYHDHFYGLNKDFNDYSFLEDLYKLNNEYMGLGLGNMYMSSGMDYVSQNTLYSDYGRSLMADLTSQNGTAATAAAIAASIPGPDQWVIASPADRTKIGLENGIYKSYTLVGAYKTKRQVGQRDNATNGETDDIVTGYEFHYETDDGKQFKSYISEIEYNLAKGIEASKDQCFSQYTQPAVLNMNTNTNPNEVVATFIAAIQYEATNGTGPTVSNIFKYFNRTGPGNGLGAVGTGIYNLGAVNFVSQGTNITANSIIFDFTGTTGAILTVNPSNLPVNRLINNALDCRDTYLGGFRNHSGFYVPQFQGIPYGFRLPQ